jgi:hypothetical protein
MNESQFKNEVRKVWLPEYWSENIEDKKELGWPDVHFLSPSNTVTLVEFKWLPKTNKDGSFIIPWKMTQPLFLLEYHKAGGNCGGLIRVYNKDYWISVRATSEWLRSIRTTIGPDSPYIIPISRETIRQYIL